MKEINCIFCDKPNTRIAIEENGYYGIKCPNCNLIYISPRPDLNEIENLYSHVNSFSTDKLLSKKLKISLVEKHHLKIVQKNLKKGSLLEIGPGDGKFLNEAKKLGYDVYGIELNSLQAKFIRNELNIPCEEKPFNKLSFNGKKFDIIFHRNVISHFYDPVAEFQKMNDGIKQNGLLIFETGNLGDVDEKYYKYFENFEYPDHLFFFSEMNLNQLLIRTNFELENIYHYSILPQLIFNKIIIRIFNIINIRPKRTPLKNDFLKLKNSSVKQQLEEKKTPRNSHGETIIKKGNYLIDFLYFIFDSISYFIQYKIGLLNIQKYQPQTLIIIAKKLKT